MNNNPLAFKSSRRIILLSITTIISFLVAIIFYVNISQTMFSGEFAFISAIFLFTGVASALVLVPMLFKPAVLIRYDDKGIYVFYSQKNPTFIKYASIINVTIQKKYFKINNDNVGALVVTTADEEFCVEEVKNAADVRDQIFTLKQNSIIK